ncbi:MAG: hypothetical protein K2I46_04555 [Clostridia bacterium]|nr:hypothetical protein [Clostridia bacterium]MDE6472755.1 hypothetical protein [Clostridia bacterium]
MQNEQQVFIRPKTPKLKNDWVTIVMKVLLYAGMFFSLFYFGKRNFNSLFIAVIDPSYTDIFGISLAGYISSMGKNMLLAMKILLPAICALLFFLFYFLYAKFFATLVFNQLRVFGVEFDIRKFRICLDGSMILLCVLIGIFQVVFNYYPLAENFGSVFIPPVLALISMAVFYFTYSKGLEKMYRPLLLNIMLLPTIVVVLFA